MSFFNSFLMLTTLVIMHFADMAARDDISLIDEVIDKHHHSRRLSQGTFCNVPKMRGPDQYSRIDPRWVPRYVENHLSPRAVI